MQYVLITISGGIIDNVKFYDSPSKAIRVLSEHVKTMNPEIDDAGVYGHDGPVANAKDFLDENDAYFENEELLSSL